MKIDLYTKIVLTIIAACLLFSAYKSIFSPREATAQGIQRVYVEGGHVTVDGTVDVNEVRSKVTVDGTVNVSSGPQYQSLKEILETGEAINVRVINPW